MTAFTVNGQEVRFEGEPRTHLADFLREDMGLTATHLGCEHGVCGACTLVKDGRPVRSCITYAAACEGAEIRTLEDFRDDPLMARIRAAFKEHHGLQCGFCTPGMLATAYDIATRLPDADEARIREELSGNLCRCTGYMGIVAAIRAVLAEGPHARPETPARAPQIGRASFGRPASPAPAAAAPGPAPGSTRGLPRPLTGATVLAREIALPLPAAEVWAVLGDIRKVAACLPGAAVERVEDGIADGSFTTRIGPMKAAFRGTAHVSYDTEAMTGRVAGQGGDAGSRSSAQGEIGFALAGDGPEACRLSCEIGYRLTGPLAQLGRPAIVAGIVDRMLEDFTANIAAAARGDAPAVAAPPGIAGLILAALRNILPGKRDGGEAS
ncbi:2Fe-2S iron-sulfur cluster-binding protein [Poseidonocella sp. HB161398]|uniref:2Fe-2S iron-sulfur cluster-binding protein n=1 Tax=Poseidonocella sp. HB161398 TaxID=2320855 RepID=UPI0011086BF1|nr:2Fe-2S iron-sulfur cluster-binding protein [Poseidonocella sp. HB161398]